MPHQQKLVINKKLVASAFLRESPKIHWDPRTVGAGSSVWDPSIDRTQNIWTSKSKLLLVGWLCETHFWPISKKPGNKKSTWASSGGTEKYGSMVLCGSPLGDRSTRAHTGRLTAGDECFFFGSRWYLKHPPETSKSAIWMHACLQCRRYNILDIRIVIYIYTFYCIYTVYFRLTLTILIYV